MTSKKVVLNLAVVHIGRNQRLPSYRLIPFVGVNVYFANLGSWRLYWSCGYYCDMTLCGIFMIYISIAGINGAMEARTLNVIPRTWAIRMWRAIRTPLTSNHGYSACVMPCAVESTWENTKTFCEQMLESKVLEPLAMAPQVWCRWNFVNLYSSSAVSKNTGMQFWCYDGKSVHGETIVDTTKTIVDACYFETIASTMTMGAT
jgi:hypothetical protein